MRALIKTITTVTAAVRGNESLSDGSDLRIWQGCVIIEFMSFRTPAW